MTDQQEELVQRVEAALGRAGLRSFRGSDSGDDSGVAINVDTSADRQDSGVWVIWEPGPDLIAESNASVLAGEYDAPAIGELSAVGDAMMRALAELLALYGLAAHEAEPEMDPGALLVGWPESPPSE